MTPGAPVTFVTGAILIAGAVWLGAGVFYKEELAAAHQETASAKQETAAVAAQRDAYKGRLDLVNQAAKDGFCLQHWRQQGPVPTQGPHQ